MSPTVYDGRLFVGVSSQEESAAAIVPDYKCCTFVGNMVGVDFNRATRKLDIAWNTPMISQADFAQGWSGAAIWGSQPSIDVVRSQVGLHTFTQPSTKLTPSQLFIATGNTYTVPPGASTISHLTALANSTT
jgi:hypothetical protein